MMGNVDDREPTGGRTIGAPRAHWIGDGFLIRRYITRTAALRRSVGPFLLLDHHAPFAYPPTPFERGLDPHPHRGFETVTVVFEGTLAHRDSAGARGTIGPGDVQWMTAGRGILHREYHDPSFALSGGRLHMLQLWVNLPAAQKMTEPRYQALRSHAIPTVTLPDGRGTVRVIAGAFAGIAGAATTATPVVVLDAVLADGCVLPVDVEPAHAAAVLVIGGHASIDGGCIAESGDFVILDRTERKIAIEARSPRTHVFVITGEPIDEPLVARGPYFMNTEDELRLAYADQRAGGFGRLA